MAELTARQLMVSVRGVALLWIVFSGCYNQGIRELMEAASNEALDRQLTSKWYIVPFLSSSWAYSLYLFTSGYLSYGSTAVRYTSIHDLLSLIGIHFFMTTLPVWLVLILFGGLTPIRSETTTGRVFLAIFGISNFQPFDPYVSTNYLFLPSLEWQCYLLFILVYALARKKKWDAAITFGVSYLISVAVRLLTMVLVAIFTDDNFEMLSWTRTVLMQQVTGGMHAYILGALLRESISRCYMHVSDRTVVRPPVGIWDVPDQMDEGTLDANFICVISTADEQSSSTFQKGPASGSSNPQPSTMGSYSRDGLPVSSTSNYQEASKHGEPASGSNPDIHRSPSSEQMRKSIPSSQLPVSSLAAPRQSTSPQGPGLVAEGIGTYYSVEDFHQLGTNRGSAEAAMTQLVELGTRATLSAILEGSSPREEGAAPPQSARRRRASWRGSTRIGLAQRGSRSSEQATALPSSESKRRSTTTSSDTGATTAEGSKADKADKVGGAEKAEKAGSAKKTRKGVLRMRGFSKNASRSEATPTTGPTTGPAASLQLGDSQTVAENSVPAKQGSSDSAAPSPASQTLDNFPSRIPQRSEEINERFPRNGSFSLAGSVTQLIREERESTSMNLANLNAPSFPASTTSVGSAIPTVPPVQTIQATANPPSSTNLAAPQPPDSLALNFVVDGLRATQAVQAGTARRNTQPRQSNEFSSSMPNLPPRQTKAEPPLETTEIQRAAAQSAPSTQGEVVPPSTDSSTPKSGGRAQSRFQKREARKQARLRLKAEKQASGRGKTGRVAAKPAEPALELAKDALAPEITIAASVTSPSSIVPPPERPAGQTMARGTLRPARSSAGRLPQTVAELAVAQREPVTSSTKSLPGLAGPPGLSEPNDPQHPDEQGVDYAGTDSERGADGDGTFYWANNYNSIRLDDAFESLTRLMYQRREYGDVFVGLMVAVLVGLCLLCDFESLPDCSGKHTHWEWAFLLGLGEPAGAIVHYIAGFIILLRGTVVVEFFLSRKFLNYSVGGCSAFIYLLSSIILNVVRVETELLQVGPYNIWVVVILLAGFMFAGFVAGSFMGLLFSSLWNFFARKFYTSMDVRRLRRRMKKYREGYMRHGDRQGDRHGDQLSQSSPSKAGL